MIKGVEKPKKKNDWFSPYWFQDPTLCPRSSEGARAICGVWVGRGEDVKFNFKENVPLFCCSDRLKQREGGKGGKRTNTKTTQAALRQTYRRKKNWGRKRRGETR